MRLNYQSLWVELPYSAVQILDIKMSAGINCHAHLLVSAICEEEELLNYIDQPVEYEKIQAGYRKNKKFLFLLAAYWKQGLFTREGRRS